MTNNRYSELYKKGELLIVQEGVSYTVCTINSRGKLISLKKRLGYWEANGYILNRANKKKKPNKPKRGSVCSCCGSKGDYLKVRTVPYMDKYGEFPKHVLCKDCRNKRYTE